MFDNVERTSTQFNFCWPLCLNKNAPVFYNKSLYSAMHMLLNHSRMMNHTCFSRKKVPAWAFYNIGDHCSTMLNDVHTVRFLLAIMSQQKSTRVVQQKSHCVDVTQQTWIGFGNHRSLLFTGCNNILYSAMHMLLNHSRIINHTCFSWSILMHRPKHPMNTGYTGMWQISKVVTWKAV